MHGLPWWFSSYEFTHCCRGHGFSPFSGKILHAKRLTKAVCHNDWACVQQLLKLMHPIEKAHSSVQLLSHVRLSATPRTAAHQASQSIVSSRDYSNSWPLSQWCHPTISSSSVIPFSSSLQSFPASGSFQMSQSVLHIRWSKYWSFICSISSSKEYSGLISFTIDWFDLLAVKGTLKNLLQHHGSKASILQCSAL